MFLYWLSFYVVDIGEKSICAELDTFAPIGIDYEAHIFILIFAKTN